MKDIITIFYSPLAQVYRAASIAESIGDLQNFINDLIRTVETCEECMWSRNYDILVLLTRLPAAPVSQEDPRQTVQTFIDLIQRHEQSFYYFVHKVHSKGEGLFSGLMHWTERFLDVIRNGIGEPISLEFILPHSGEERQAIIKEIDEVALYHYKLKVQHESKIRRRFGRAGGTDGAGDDPAEQEIVNGFMHDMSFGDLMQEDAMDMAAEGEESDFSDDESSGSYETDSETASEESGRSPPPVPVARPHMSTSTPPVVQDHPPSRHSSEQPFPSSKQQQQQQQPLPLPPYTDPSTPPRAPSVVVATPGSRIRRLSQSLRKSRSMTFGTARPSPEASSLPPVPPLPLSVAQSRSAASIAARSKPIPPLPSSPSSSRGASSSRTVPHEAPAHKRHPTGQSLPQTPARAKKKQVAAGEGLKPPELKKMLELLPIFIEMVRCLFLTVHPFFDFLMLFGRCGHHYFHRQGTL